MDSNNTRRRYPAPQSELEPNKWLTFNTDTGDQLALLSREARERIQRIRRALEDNAANAQASASRTADGSDRLVSSELVIRTG
jgi:hypothetical protein